MAEVDRLVAELRHNKREDIQRPNVYFIRADKGITQAQEYLYDHGLLSGLDVRNVLITNDRVRSNVSARKDKLLESLTLDYSNNPLILSGSGNLHHYTYAFCRNLIDRRRIEYSVLDFDRHLDYARTGNSVSCGSFNYAVIRDSPYVYDLIIVSNPTSVLKYSKDANDVSQKNITTRNASMNERLRNIIQELDSPYVYITLDLDCLRHNIQTDYGNGSLEMDFVLRSITDVSNQKEIIGMDICGLRSFGVNQRTLQTYSRIFELVSNMRYSSLITISENRNQDKIRREIRKILDRG